MRQITTKANITIVLVPEALSKSKRSVEKEIAKSLQCDWLLRVEKVAVIHDSISNNKNNIHRRMLGGKEVGTDG